jgi:hypothetical protein
VELRAGQALALLPSSIAQELGLPEEVVLGEEGAALLYGSPLLDRLVRLATQDTPVTYAQIEVPYLKKEGFDQLLSQDLAFLDGQVRVVGRAEARASYMVLVCHYVALSDERKEGLIRVAVQEGTGALVPEMEAKLAEFRPQFFHPDKVPPHFQEDLNSAVASALRGAKVATEGELAEFFRSMTRRLRRDARNTRDYYEALRREMEASLGHPNLTSSQREDRMAKIRDLPTEMTRKIEDLENKYRMKVTITARAALRFLVAVAQIMVELRHRKWRREARLTWNPVTRRLDPLACEVCRETARRVQLVGSDAGIRLVCLDCGAGKR